MKLKRSLQERALEAALVYIPQGARVVRDLDAMSAILAAIRVCEEALAEQSSQPTKKEE